MLTKQEIEESLAIARREGFTGNEAIARTALALMAQLEDAKAAQALVVERAAEMFAPLSYGCDPNCEACAESRAKQDAIRALADPSGVEAVAALRAERDALETAREMLGGFWAEAAADRDRLAAANAALEAQVARLVGALHDAINSPKGVVPKSADPFYDQNLAAVQADARRDGEGGE